MSRWIIIGILLGITMIFGILSGIYRGVGINRNRKKRNRLIVSGLKLIVTLDKCIVTVVDNSIIEEEERSNINKEPLSVFDIHDEEKVKHRKYNNAKLTYITRINGEDYTFESESFYMDSISLSFYFEKYKETYIYYNENDINDYYFDIEFLK